MSHMCDLKPICPTGLLCLLPADLRLLQCASAVFPTLIAAECGKGVHDGLAYLYLVRIEQYMHAVPSLSVKDNPLLPPPSGCQGLCTPFHHCAQLLGRSDHLVVGGMG